MKVKYIYIPANFKLKENRFFMGFKTPENEGYFFMSRQTCKKIPENDDSYLGKIDLNNKYNHKLIDIETEENMGLISDLDIFSFFEECTNFNIINSVFPEKITIKKENVNPDIEDLVVRMEILEKEIEILKLRLKNLEK